MLLIRMTRSISFKEFSFSPVVRVIIFFLESFGLVFSLFICLLAELIGQSLLLSLRAEEDIKNLAVIGMSILTLLHCFAGSLVWKKQGLLRQRLEERIKPQSFEDGLAGVALTQLAGFYHRLGIQIDKAETV